VGAHSVCARHCRSLCVPAGANSHSVAVHTLWLRHSRSWCVPNAVISHCELVHVVCEEHTRSLVLVGAAVSYCVAEHVVTALHVYAPVASCQCVSPPHGSHAAWPGEPVKVPAGQSEQDCATPLGLNRPASHAWQLPLFAPPQAVWNEPPAQL
jgi:hypothetical protein